MPKSEHGHGGARPGSGPKPKPLSRQRRNRVLVNLTDEELRALRAAAGKGSASAYVRELLLEHLRRRRS